MSEYQDYSFSLTLEQLKDIAAVYTGPITITINGMHYDLQKEG